MTCRFARGTAVSGLLADSSSGSFARHSLFPRLAKCVAAVSHRRHKSVAQVSTLPLALLHDCALALALTRSWDEKTARVADLLVQHLPEPSALAGFGAPPPPLEGVTCWTSADRQVALAGESMAGATSDGSKE